MRILELKFEDSRCRPLKIIDFREVKEFPEHLNTIEDTSLVIESIECARGSSDIVLNFDTKMLIKRCTLGAYTVEISEELYFKFRRLFIEKNAYIYDYCNELNKTQERLRGAIID